MYIVFSTSLFTFLVHFLNLHIIFSVSCFHAKLYNFYLIYILHFKTGGVARFHCFFVIIIVLKLHNAILRYFICNWYKIDCSFFSVYQLHFIFIQIYITSIHVLKKYHHYKCTYINVFDILFVLQNI